MNLSRCKSFYLPPPESVVTPKFLRRRSTFTIKSSPSARNFFLTIRRIIELGVLAYPADNNGAVRKVF
jgi:hypothetical protein